MSYIRDHQPDIDLIVGRDTFQGHDFLAPAKQQAQIVLYDVALKALQNGQIPTALMTTTNTLEVGLIDTNGERAQYTQECHSLIALHRNKILGRDDHFWSCGAPDETILLSPKQAIHALAELYCRPIEFGLVEDLRHWKGAKLLPEQWGEVIRLVPHVQSGRATYTAPVEFEFLPPWILRQHYSVKKAIELVTEAIQSRADELNASRLSRLGTSRVLGKQGCERLNPLGRRAEPCREPQPEFRGTKKQVRKAITARRAYRKYYAGCIEHFRGDRKDVVFPRGTVMMRKLGAFCDPLPASRIPFPHATFPRPPTDDPTSVADALRA